MRIPTLVITNLLLAASVTWGGEAAPGGIVDGAAAFDRLKGLAGQWEADTPAGKARLSYELIAGGSALVERVAMGTMPVMLTVYNLDGGRLLLTHYCMAGNQPRMQAQAFDPATGNLEFRFLDATNLPNPAAGHMHNASFRLIDADHLATAWEFYEDGHLKMTETARYTRVR